MLPTLRNLRLYSIPVELPLPLGQNIEKGREYPRTIVTAIGSRLVVPLLRRILQSAHRLFRKWQRSPTRPHEAWVSEYRSEQSILQRTPSLRDRYASASDQALEPSPGPCFSPRKRSLWHSSAKETVCDECFLSSLGTHPMELHLPMSIDAGLGPRGHGLSQHPRSPFGFYLARIRAQHLRL